jgi:hypothetical protein
LTHSQPIASLLKKIMYAIVLSLIFNCVSIFNLMFLEFLLQPPMPFDFTYEVKDDPTYQDFSHSEASDGKVVTGSYRVSLPDGRIQIVSYKADENGYVADVKYEGEAKYDEYKPTAAPAYPKPAEPAYPKPADEPTYPETKPEAKPETKPYPVAAEPAYPKPSYPEPAYPKPTY